MGVKVYEGVVERTSNATITNGRLTRYEFIEIGGQRVMNVQAGNLIDTFINVGDDIAIGCDKSWFGPHKVCAIREPNGRITKENLAAFIIVALIMFGCGMVLALIPMVLAFGFMSPAAVLTVWVGFAAGLAWLVTKNLFKARNALDALPSKKPVVQTV